MKRKMIAGVLSTVLAFTMLSTGSVTEYSCAAEPPVQCSVSHLSRRSEPQ